MCVSRQQTVLLDIKTHSRHTGRAGLGWKGEGSFRSVALTLEGSSQPALILPREGVGCVGQ